MAQKEAFHQASPTEAFLMDCWYVAAWDHDLIDGKLLARADVLFVNQIGRAHV